MGKLAEAKRQALMACIRSSGTWPERVVAAMLREAGIGGHTANDRNLPGTLDFSFPKLRKIMGLSVMIVRECVLRRHAIRAGSRIVRFLGRKRR